jgi:Raf kinase inhibitor-like YbhB/YbcL family protein
MRRSVRLLVATGVILSACAPAQGPGAAAPAGGALTLTSTAFQEGAAIPLRNSAYGDNVSPAFSWTNVPEGTRSFALVLDDPDAGTNAFVHWVIYNIPGTARGLPEGLPTDAALTAPAQVAGARQGMTGLRRTGYFGPRPPAGPVHHYNFRLYALSSEPNLPEGLTRDALMEAISGDILGQATLMGTYQATAE